MMLLTINLQIKLDGAQLPFINLFPRRQGLFSGANSNDRENLLSTDNFSTSVDLTLYICVCVCR